MNSKPIQIRPGQTGWAVARYPYLLPPGLEHRAEVKILSIRPSRGAAMVSDGTGNRWELLNGNIELPFLYEIADTEWTDESDPRVLGHLTAIIHERRAIFEKREREIEELCWRVRRAGLSDYTERLERFLTDGKKRLHRLAPQTTAPPWLLTTYDQTADFFMSENNDSWHLRLVGKIEAEIAPGRFGWTTRDSDAVLPPGLSERVLCRVLEVKAKKSGPEIIIEDECERRWIVDINVFTTGLMFRISGYTKWFPEYHPAALGALHVEMEQARASNGDIVANEWRQWVIERNLDPRWRGKRLIWWNRQYERRGN